MIGLILQKVKWSIAGWLVRWFYFLIDRLHIQKVDMGAGPFTVTLARSQVVDFTTSFYEESTAILIPPPTEDTRLFSCARPFQLQVNNTKANKP